jgi:polysaccharide export outer membrane protein
VLGIGDEIRMTVYGEDDLSGQYQIGSTGIVALPLVGNVPAAGHTIDQFEQAVRDKLTKGYLNDPRVSVQVANYRPFFILGEVAKPGSYPYVNGMTVLSAVATAGGYTYRADRGDVRVTHANVANKEEEDINETSAIMPGDVIRVTERFF